MAKHKLPDADVTDLPPSAPAIAVGVTGHRLERLDPADIAFIRDVAASVMSEIVAAAKGTAEQLSFRLVTGLADGADSIVADLAISKGWAVDAVLAFPREDFARDFAEGAERDALECRIETAHSIFELPGARTDAGSGIAYERVGHTVLAQCDILLAIWDNAPARGRGGAAQIVADAVLLNIPVIQIDPVGKGTPILLWDGLDEHDLGAQTVDTVARGGIDQLPALMRHVVELPDDPLEVANFKLYESKRRHRSWLAIAYPMLLLVTGTYRRRPSIKIDARSTAELPDAFAPNTQKMLSERFARADMSASHFARMFRSGYVTNFSFAALAVVLSLLGLALPSSFKLILITLELSTIAVILFTTRAGNKSGWHRRWLDNRQLAERLRCLAVSAQLGELTLRGSTNSGKTWVDWYARRTAREVGLPTAYAGTAYLTRVRNELLALVDEQITYLGGEGKRMHRLEHRLHGVGTLLFATTALICVALLAFKGMSQLVPHEGLIELPHPMLIAATILSAALPAIGAAIYGIRMQGDFAGTAERCETLGHHLVILRKAIDADDLSFDTLQRRVKRATDLLTEDLANWLATYHARPLTLPG